eukprot:5525746-Prymnesium_polylepis.1
MSSTSMVDVDGQHQDVSFHELRDAKLVGSRGPPPKPALIAIANQLARGELAGTPIAEQSIAGIAAKFGQQYADSGGFRTRAHAYARAILRFHEVQARIASEAAEDFAGNVLQEESVDTGDPTSERDAAAAQQTSLPQNLLSPHFTVGASSVQAEP